MVYRAIGLMSGSSLDGLDIVFAEFDVTGQKWSYEIKQAECISYSEEWTQKLKRATSLPAADYMQLHVDYGHFLGETVKAFIQKHNLEFKVQLIGSHGHTTFHNPATHLSHQLGDGAAIAAITGINVVSDLRNMDVALGGQGAPIVPIGEKNLLDNYDYFLNIGGIANISANKEPYIAFDICAANRVLNLLANETGLSFDEGGALARKGQVHHQLLAQLNQLDYYNQSFPKSLSNQFGTDIVFPLIKQSDLSTADALCTYAEHVAMQVGSALESVRANASEKMLITGGGALNHHLVERIQLHTDVEVIIPDELLIRYKEALIMAHIGILRWREEYNVLSTVTGAQQNSVGGAVWSGQD